MSDTLNILVQSSNYYAPMAGVMLTSLFENNQNITNINVYLLTSDMSQKNRDRFLALAEQYQRIVRFLDANKIDQFCEENDLVKWNNSYATYYKLFALSVIEEDIDRLIYLDSDMLVISSLASLMSIDLENNILGMCIDMVPESHKERIGINSEFYYNAGMIVFDVKKWLKENFIDKIIYHVKNVQANYPVVDQDILNVVLMGNIKTLPIQYNTYTYFYTYKDYNFIKEIYGVKNWYSNEEFADWEKKAVILHCFPIMTMYPWNIGNVHPVKDLWWQYLAGSPWSDFTLSKSPKEFIYRVQRICYKLFPRKLYAFTYRTLLKILLWRRAKKAGIK